MSLPKLASQADLLAYISSRFELNSSDNIDLILREGRAFILLDGLDEVREDLRIRIKQED